jgi:prevent-host-death family protein
MMQQVNIHEAKTHLSQLIEKAVQGEPFIIAKAGKPLVLVQRITSATKQRRVGFMAGQITIPPNFDRMCDAEIEQLFGNDE